jgi:Cu-processing system permease protein
VTGRHIRAVAWNDLRILARVRWVRGVMLAGIALAALIAANASGKSGLDQADALRSGAASLLLLGGLVVAVCLGAGAFANDASRGYLGLLVGTGAGPSAVGVGRALARLAALALVIAAWGAALQAGSALIGDGADGPLAVHTLSVFGNLVLVLCASAAMASVIGPVAAGVFGVGVYISAQAAVNLKAALDVGALSGDSGAIVTPIYALFPRALVSPMINEMQARGVAGPAAPALNVSGVEVVVPSSPWLSVIWTLMWAGIFAALAAYGVRRRQL